MRLLAFLRKTFLENLRDWKILILTLTFAPCFVVLLWGYYGAAPPSWRVEVVDRDGSGGSPAAGPGSRDLLQVWREARNADETPVFVVSEGPDPEAARTRLARREVDLVVEIPPGFGDRLARWRPTLPGGGDAQGGGPPAEPALLVNHGDPAAARSSMAMALSDYHAFTWAAAVTGAPVPLTVEARSVGTGERLTEFDLYVPAMLVLAAIMVMFTAAATLIKEVDRGTIQRLRLSRLSVGELLVAVSVNQVLIGVVAIGLTWLTAVAVGYHGQGSVLAVLVVGAVATLAVVAMSIVVAAFLRTLFELLTVGCFPFFGVMFFSDCMFPLPKAPLVAIGGHQVWLNDLLPTALAVRALTRILSQGAGLSDVWFETVLALGLTAGYFMLGTWLFHRRHYRFG